MGVRENLMHDRKLQFSYTGALATVCGVIAVGLLIATFLSRNFTIGFASMHFAVGSALFRVRSWFCALEARERNAYELGRDSVQLRKVT